MKKKLVFLGLFLSLVSLVNAQTIQDARKLTENEQFEAASAIYQHLISVTPTDASLYYYYGDNLLSGGGEDSAKIIFEKGSTVDPNNLLIKIGRAKTLLNTTNIHEAKVASDKDPSNPELKNRLEDATNNVKAAMVLIDEAVSKASTKDPRTLIEAAEALIHYKNKDLDKAKTILDKANGIDGKNSEINLLYGDIYTELNNGTLAADYYNRALEINQSLARALVSKGKLYKRSTNFEGAAQEFEKAITIDPDYAPAHRELGEVSFKLGKLDKAKEEYRRYLELSKNNCGARLRYASFLYFSKNYTDALAELNQVQQKCDSNNILMLRIFTYSYFETKEYDKGLKTVEHLFRLLTQENRTSMDYEYYGKLLGASNSGKDSLAIEQLQKAYALDPSKTDVLREMANIWIKLKQYPNAIINLQQLVSGGKDVKVVDHYNLGRALYYNNQFGLADSSFKNVNELSPKYASGWLWRADVNSHIDSTSEQGLAKPFYEKYDSLAEADSANGSKYINGLIKAYGYLAYYYILKKDNANALFYLKKKLALPLEPEDKKSVIQGIDQLEGRTPKTK